MNREDLDSIVPAALTEAGIRELIAMARTSLEQADALAAFAASVMQLSADVAKAQAERDEARLNAYLLAECHVECITPHPDTMKAALAYPVKP